MTRIVHRVPIQALACSLGLLFGSSFEATMQAQPEKVRVFSGVPDDARLGKATTLDGYHEWKPVRDIDAWKKRRARVRRQILVAAGLWPMPEKTPLEAVVHGAIDRGEYTIEKVYFQSFPGFYVTGNLYRPKGRTGRRPGVLCPHGHWSNGRFYKNGDAAAKKEIAAGAESTMNGARYPLQARMAHLARMGCVVFHYDMIGYADSKQVDHRKTFGDVENELRLQSVFGLQTYNTIRAYDFLESLSDVDPKRIGVTGASGGGTQTFILCAIDDRPAACFPAVMVSTDMQGGCVCENASHLRVGTTNVEFAALAAPKPYGVTVANDWTREMMSKGFPELRAQFEVYGKADHVQAFSHTEFGHNYNQVSREHMYGWFKKHLKLEADAPTEERDFEPVPPSKLSVFEESHMLPEDRLDVAGIAAYLTKRSREQLQELTPSDEPSLAKFRRVVGGGLAAILHTEYPDADGVESRLVSTEEFESGELYRFALSRKGAGEAVPAVFYRPRDFTGVIVCLFAEGGKADAAFRADGRTIEGLDELIERGVGIVTSDLFLTGEYLRDGETAETLLPRDSGRHDTFVGYTYGYNRTLIAQRVHDILTTLAFAKSRDGAEAVHLVARGPAAKWGLMARALAPDVVSKAMCGGGNVERFAAIDRHDHPDFLPGALAFGDIDAFIALAAPQETIVVSRGELEPIVEKAYTAAGAEAAFRHLQPSEVDAEAGLLEWLSSK